MWDFLERVFGGGFMPHGHCYLWTPSMIWAQVTSNTLIGLAYLCISLTLAYLVRRVSLPFSWVYIAFGVFILACGITHFFDVITVWHPVYWMDAGVRVVTAIASVGTAILLFPLVPKVLAIAKLSEVAADRGRKLQDAVKELTQTNDLLHQKQEEAIRLAAENARLAERARTQEFQERFLAILGHDLRNPLAAIDMGIGLLGQTIPADDTRVLRRMESSSKRMSRMIEQILDLTRSRLTGHIEIRPVPSDLKVSLLQVVEEARAANPSHTINFTSPDTLPGTWDRDRLEQVLSNLVGNAVHYGRPGTPVTVEARQENQHAVVAVHNEGEPIPAELREKIFDPFRRGSRDSRAKHTEGLGLGLFISREVAVAHRGTLEVVSTSSEGTSFRLTIPTEAGDTERAQ